MPLALEVQSTLRKIRQYVEDLEENVDERQNLVDVLQLTPSSNDNYELVTLLEKLAKYLNYAHQDIMEVMQVSLLDADRLIDQFNNIVDRFLATTEILDNDTYIDISEYRYEPLPFTSPLNTTTALKPQKSVRFTDNVDEEEPPGRQNPGVTRPYRDDVSDLNIEYSDAESLDMGSSQQVFAQHHQMLLEQDSSLDILHESITRQHRMGTMIGSEVDDQLVLLDDLEAGVDDSEQRLARATRGMTRFRKMCRENGSMMTIVILTVILILLLVVLN